MASRAGVSSAAQHIVQIRDRAWSAREEQDTVTKVSDQEFLASFPTVRVSDSPRNGHLTFLFSQPSRASLAGYGTGRMNL